MDLSDLIIFDKYVETLQNNNVNHQPFVVMCAGISASGKTTICRKLADVLRGVLVSTDDVRTTIRRLDPEISNDKLEDHTLTFTREFYPRLFELPNKLHVGDINISSAPRHIIKQLEGLHVRFYVVQLNISRDTAIKRVTSRTEHIHSHEFIVSRLDELIAMYEMFDREYGEYIDYRLDNENFPSIDGLVTDISRKYSELYPDSPALI